MLHYSQDDKSPEVSCGRDQLSSQDDSSPLSLSAKLQI